MEPVSNPAVNINPAPAAPPIPPVVQPNIPGDSESKLPMFAMVLTGIAILLAIAGGAWWYMNKQNNTQITKQQTQEINTLVEEINAIEVGDIESDLSEIDKDLESL